MGAPGSNNKVGSKNNVIKKYISTLVKNHERDVLRYLLDIPLVLISSTREREFILMIKSTSIYNHLTTV
jgi:hypothetical protein